MKPDRVQKFTCFYDAMKLRDKSFAGQKTLVDFRCREYIYRPRQPLEVSVFIE